jgi:hypothetical protein
VAEPHWSGEVWFDSGRVVAAAVGNERGLLALDALWLGLSGGQASFHEASAPEERDLDLDLDGLQSHLARLSARTRHTATPSLTAVPRLVQPRAAASRTEQFVLARSTVATLRDIRKGGTVAEIARSRGLGQTLRDLMLLVQQHLVRVDEPRPPSLTRADAPAPIAGQNPDWSGRSVASHAALALLLAAGLTLLLAQFAVESLGAEILVLVGLVFAVCLFPGVRWFLGPRTAVPIFESICLSYGAQYAMPALLLPNVFDNVNGSIYFSEADLATALRTSLVGLTAMVATYMLFLRSPLSRRVPVLDLPLDGSRLRFYLPVAVFGGAFLSALQAAGWGPTGDSGFYAIVLVLANQLSVAVALLTFLVIGGKSKRTAYLLLLVCAIVAAVVIGMTTSMLESVFAIPVIVGIIGLQYRKRIVWVLLGGMACAYLLLLQPIKAEYRAQLSNASSELSLVDRLGIWYDVAQSYLDRASTQASPADTLDTTRTSLTRLDFIHVLAHVEAFTPSVVPYYNGSTYSYFLYGWIPRLVWPDKPGALDRNIELILDYGLITEAILETTMMSIGTLAEAYANFAYPGVVVLMAVQGVILALCSRSFAGRGSIGAQAVLLSVLVTFLNGVTSSTAILYGGLLQNLAANTLLLWLLSGRWTLFRRPVSDERRLSQLPARLRRPVTL